MSLKFRIPALLIVLLLTSVIGLAASPTHENAGLQSHSIKNLVIYGALGVRILSSPSN
jgi:hypothetical protein